MKKDCIKILLTCTFLAGSFYNCKNFSNANTSRATGWQINNPKGGFQQNNVFREQETPPGTVFIEGGTFTKGRLQDDIMQDWNNTPSQQHVQSFYMDQTEVTNIMYLEYLNYLKTVYPPENPNYANIYSGALPDTLVWRNQFGFNETLTTNYLRHPAYADYPVVGVSWLQATQYAEWRTDRVNELRLEKEGYLAKGTRYQALNGDVSSTFSTETYLSNPEATYGGAIASFQGKKTRDSTGVFAKRGSGILMPEYRLPTEIEWEYAAQALISNREYNTYKGRKRYPWSGSNVRSERRFDRGDLLANFKQGKGDYGGIAGWSDDGADITAPVSSYRPNDFGLYDMAGNVNEWVADVYRPILEDEISDFNYYRGNVFEQNVIGEDGKVEVLEDEVVYQTLPNGKIIAVSLPGEVRKTPVNWQEPYLRNGAEKDNNQDYYDDGEYPNAEEDTFTEENIYQDEPSRIASLIDDEARVYKGGSWKDRVFWLDPAQRRYLPQYMAANDIGFRCAVSRIGYRNTIGGKTTKYKRPRG